MKKMTFLMMGLGLIWSLGASAFELVPSQTVIDGKLTKILSLPNRMAIYTFDVDEPGKSNCSGTCAEKWPPVFLNQAEAQLLKQEGLAVIKRANGLLHLTHNGRPVYTYFEDRLHGDVLGQGLGGVWFVIPVTEPSPGPAPQSEIQ